MGKLTRTSQSTLQDKDFNSAWTNEDPVLNIGGGIRFTWNYAADPIAFHIGKSQSVRYADSEYSYSPMRHMIKFFEIFLSIPSLFPGVLELKKVHSVHFAIKE